MIYAIYVYKEKFDSIKISVLRDVRKIWKTSSVSKMLRKFILHHNNAEKLQLHFFFL